MIQFVRHLAVCLVLCLFVVAGCSSGTNLPRCYPVRGKVTLDGRAVADAQVVFHPLEDDAAQISNPIAFTKQDGSFELTTLKSGDGAPLGQYGITVELRELKADGDQMVRDGRNLLPEIYRDPKTSTFHFLVEASPNEVPTLELKSK